LGRGPNPSRQGEQFSILLKPQKRAQGREMNQKSRMASALILAGVLAVSFPSAVYATSPLLSGYGGPGTGEQAIIGSTLINGSQGGGGSSGSSGSGGSSSSSGIGASEAPNGGGLTSPGGSTSRSENGGRHGSVGSRGSASPTGNGAGSISGARRDGRTSHASKYPNAYVYPDSAQSASVSASTLGISGGDLLVLVGVLGALGLLGALTARLRGLQT
jgi:hypothetical protein